MATWRARENASRRGSFLAALAVAVLCGAPGFAAWAEEGAGEAAHRVRFTVESSREVANDWITAIVSVSAEDAESAAVAQTVNTTMKWALDKARKAKGIEARSGGYNTYPVHENGKLRRWRATQDLVLESEDVDAMTELVGALQARLQLRSFSFSVSRATREQVQEALVAEVLVAFQARARLIAESLGAGGYAIDELDLDTGRVPGPRPMMRAQMAEASMAPPAVEGGSSQVTVVAHGGIVLE